MRVACIQLRSGADVDVNLAAADMWITQAAAKGATFIATPENTALIQSNKTQLFAEISGKNAGKMVEHFSALAKRLNIHLLIGSLPALASADKAFNRSYLFDPEGQIKAHYDKMHLFDVQINERETWRESATYQAGEDAVLADIEDMKLGMSICYDLRFAALYKHYAVHGAHMLSIPSAFTAISGEAHWEALLRARAIETSSYVIAPAQGGLHDNDRETWGHSMIIDPWGEIIAQLDHQEPGFVVADINRERVEDIRSRIPAWSQSTDLPPDLPRAHD
jgi:predicted amidohydrolase